MKRAGRQLVVVVCLSACSAASDRPTTSGGGPIQTGDPGVMDTDASGGQNGSDGSIPTGTDSGMTVTPTPGTKPDAGFGTPVAGEEVCNTGLDEDLDGLVDENCPCTPGTSQACYLGPADRAGQICPAGMQSCRGSEFAAWGPCESTGAPFPTNACECFPEICDNKKDDNCNGQVDEGCVVMVPVDIDGDCVKASCPAWAPYPVGCNIVMDGGDSRGCVASTVTSSEVYFQEGNVCGAGRVTGTLTCSSQPGAPLSQQTCAINKSDKLFVERSNQCP